MFNFHFPLCVSSVTIQGNLIGGCKEVLKCFISGFPYVKDSKEPAVGLLENSSPVSQAWVLRSPNYWQKGVDGLEH